MEAKRTFTFERETKRTLRYTEVENTGETVLVGIIYVQKSFFKNIQPDEITVTVSY